MNSAKPNDGGDRFRRVFEFSFWRCLKLLVFVLSLIVICAVLAVGPSISQFARTGGGLNYRATTSSMNDEGLKAFGTVVLGSLVLAAGLDAMQPDGNDPKIAAERRQRRKDLFKLMRDTDVPGGYRMTALAGVMVGTLGRVGDAMSETDRKWEDARRRSEPDWTIKLSNEEGESAGSSYSPTDTGASAKDAGEVGTGYSTVKRRNPNSYF